jgi:hypothetical protein
MKDILWRCFVGAALALIALTSYFAYDAAQDRMKLDCTAYAAPAHMHAYGVVGRVVCSEVDVDPRKVAPTQ